jgi:uncharacterized protein YjaZ
VEEYESLNGSTVTKIRENTKEVIQKCQSKLPLPNEQLNIFIMPWFPGENEKVFRGTMGYAPWESTFHLQIDPRGFSIESIRETVAHEYNHAVYLCHHISANTTIFDSMIMEGFAENFREEMVGGDQAPWSVALSEEEAKKAFKDLQGSLDKIDHSLHNKIFFGSEDYKRWTGYSVGYRIVSDFLQNRDQVEWSKVMKMDSQDIIEKSSFKFS